MKRFCSILFLLLIASLSVFGNFDVIFFGASFITKFLFLSLFLCLLISLIVRGNISIKIILLLLFFCIGIIYFIVVASLHNVNISQTINEIMPYFVPLISCLILGLYTKDECDELMKKAIWILFLFAVMHLVVSVSSLWTNKLYSLFYYFYNDWSRLDYINPSDGTLPFMRVQVGYSIVLLLLLYLLLDEYLINKNKKKLFYIVFTILAILTMQSRAFILFIMLIYPLYRLYLIVFKVFNSYKSRIIIFILTLLSPSLLISIILNVDILGSMGLSRAGSDDLRLLQFNSLINSFSNNPLFGYGLGNHSNIIRSESTPWIYELNNIAIFSKIGIIGTILLFLFIFSFSIFLVRNIKIKDLKRYSLLFSFLFLYILSSNSNPYLANICGGTTLMMCFVMLGMMERNNGKS